MLLSYIGEIIEKMKEEEQENAPVRLRIAYALNVKSTGF